MEIKMYKIRAITHMQPGSGENTMGVIDNMVQRDPATGWPVIHASSIKGALREFFVHATTNNGEDIIKHIFGKSNANNDQTSPGKYRFLPAILLVIPQRSNKKPYYVTTSPGVIKQFLNLTELLNYNIGEEIKKDLKSITNLKSEALPAAMDNEKLIVEDFENIHPLNVSLSDTTKQLLGIQNKNLLIVSDEDFNRITNDNNLPVIARNYLENGESKNLWYEQVVPRESIFILPVVMPDDDNFYEEFNKKLKTNVIQIGGNATVGYGYTKFENLDELIKNVQS